VEIMDGRCAEGYAIMLKESRETEHGESIHLFYDQKKDQPCAQVQLNVQNIFRAQTP